ncbi:MAG: energy-coupled thiamine transporter ThiT [Clostridia bacterium]|nr:energy-coupled thiamine transporter ThiT [Clostridia bacterium]
MMFFSLLCDTGVRFTLLEELSELDGIELVTLIIAAVLAAALIVAVALYIRSGRAGGERIDEPKRGRSATQTLVIAAMMVSVSFVLSYLKLFSMPFGGSLTLLSMLPLTLFAAWYGPAYGFAAAFSYSMLQMIQGVWVVHPVQFALDYLLAYTCLGLASLFPKKAPLGVAVACFARLIVSTVSGAVFFAEYAADYGFSNSWAYSFCYNACYIGVEGVLCTIVAALPVVKRLRAQLVK